MRFRTAVSLASLFLLCFTVAVWAQPLSSRASEESAEGPTESQTVSGKISAVGDASFSVDVKKDQDMSIVQFLIDEKTLVDGKLAVGAQAIVEYRSEEGRNIATHIIVKQTSSMHWY